ncbi:MAG: gfo/Idh/MocA family oxidoreductase [Puniceicoccaceae bacterium]|nr:MAG: gfo/Idh/MocA family oxidoreductase [Puniceicoccaceae bacterium]
MKWSMATQERLRIGLIGAGANTRLRHLPGFQALPGVEVVMVANRSEASGRAVAKAFGIPKVAGSWREVVESPEVDAVCIGTWPNLHAEVTVAALDAGKHVLTEARMARNAAEARAMLAAARRHHGRVCQIVPAPFTLDFDTRIQDLLTKKTLGDLREVSMAHTNALFSDATAPLHWRQSEERSGCNMLTFGIYYETLRRWLHRDPAEVLGEGAIHTAERPDPETGRPGRVGTPDSLTVLGRYADGVRLAGHFSAVEPGRGRNELRLNGSRAGLRMDLEAGKLWLAEVGGEEKEVPLPEEERRGWQVEADFVDSIRRGTAVRLTTFEEGMRYMLVTEAVWKSWKAGGLWRVVER